jgi:copper chaperone CopZ
MNTKFLITVLCLTFFGLTSCKNEQQKTVSNTTEKTATASISKEKNLTTYELDIKGMTCAVGCAAVIQKTLAKTEGVEQSKVDFESKKGTFTFDSNQLSEQKLIEKIEQIAGGKMYKVDSARKI